MKQVLTIVIMIKCKTQLLHWHTYRLKSLPIPILCFYSPFFQHMSQELGASGTMARIKDYCPNKIHCRWQGFEFRIFWYKGICDRGCFQGTCPQSRSCFPRWAPFYPTRESWRSLQWNSFLHQQIYQGSVDFLVFKNNC